MIHPTVLALGWAAIASAHAGHEQASLSGPHESLWFNNLPGDGGTQVRSSLSFMIVVSRLTLIYPVGRLGLLRYLYLWTTALPELSCHP